MSLQEDYKKMVQDEQKQKADQTGHNRVISDYERFFSDAIRYGQLIPEYTQCIRDYWHTPDKVAYANDVANSVQKILKEAVSLIEPDKWKVANLEVSNGHIAYDSFPTRVTYYQSSNTKLPNEYVQLIDPDGKKEMHVIRPVAREYTPFFLGHFAPVQKAKLKEEVQMHYQVIKTHMAKSCRYVEIPIGKGHRSFVLFDDGSAYDSGLTVRDGIYHWDSDTWFKGPRNAPPWQSTLWFMGTDEERKDFVLHLIKTVNGD